MAEPDAPGTAALPANRWPAWTPHAFVVFVIAALVISLAAFALAQEKQRYRERAVTATQNVSRLLDQNISGMFDKIDVVLRSVAFHYGDQAALGRIDVAKMLAHLEQQESLLPEGTRLRIIDKDGLQRFRTGAPIEGPLDLSDRDYFRRARDDPSGALVVSGPVLTRATKRWVIVLARRLTAPDGSFAGVVHASFDTARFQNILASPVLGPHGAATLRMADLALVHRFPETKDAVGSNTVSKELSDIVQAHPEEGAYIASTALDGIERSNAYSKLQRYPFYVIVGVATDDYMGGWQTSVRMISGLAGLVILATALAAMLVFHSARRLAADMAIRKRAQEALLNSERQFRALAENSPDAIVRYDREGRRIYVNPEFERVTGFSAQQILGKKPAELSTEPAMAADFTQTLMAAMDAGTAAKIDLA